MKRFRYNGLIATDIIVMIKNNILIDLRARARVYW